MKKIIIILTLIIIVLLITINKIVNLHDEVNSKYLMCKYPYTINK